jgi:alkylmercury lyase-like protein
MTTRYDRRTLTEERGHFMDNRPDPQLDKCAAVAALGPAARRVHLAILAAFIDTGRPPARAELIRSAPDGAGDLHQALAELGRRDVVAFDECGEIRAAYPFSPTPTAHRVAWAGGPTVHAMCAVDALGMSAMLGCPVTIASTEPGTGRVVTVEVDGAAARWEPDTAVVFAGNTGDGCCASADRTCGHINFFTSPAAARAWAAAHPEVTGALLDQEHALATAIAEFGALLH